jgi:ABC-type polysaccharide/polyol phosphate export permease
MNPMSWFVQSMHDVMYSLTVPTWWVIPALLVGGFITFWIGFAVFKRGSEDLGEYL